VIRHPLDGGHPVAAVSTLSYPPCSRQTAHQPWHLPLRSSQGGGAGQSPPGPGGYPLPGPQPVEDARPTRWLHAALWTLPFPRARGACHPPPGAGTLHWTSVARAVPCDWMGNPFHYRSRGSPRRGDGRQRLGRRIAANGPDAVRNQNQPDPVDRIFHGWINKGVTTHVRADAPP
jgi:hypothetical protein